MTTESTGDAVSHEVALPLAAGARQFYVCSCLCSFMHTLVGFSACKENRKNTKYILKSTRKVRFSLKFNGQHCTWSTEHFGNIFGLLQRHSKPPINQYFFP